MRSDSICPVCEAPVRRAIRQRDGLPTLLDHRADIDGELGIVAWERAEHNSSWRRPIVSIVSTDAKTETPMRYTYHDCGT